MNIESDLRMITAARYQFRYQLRQVSPSQLDNNTGQRGRHFTTQWTEVKV